MPRVISCPVSSVLRETPALAPGRKCRSIRLVLLHYKATAHGELGTRKSMNRSLPESVRFAKGKTGPKGVADLGIRSWICSECGVSHDRDINSARNILFRSGHRTPAEGIPAL